MLHTLNHPLVERLAEDVERLPCCSSVTRRLAALSRSGRDDLGQLVDCVEQDPVLAARILRLVNSAQYGLACQVSSIRHAATLLGVRTLRLFALSFSLLETVSAGAGRAPYRGIVRRSHRVASFAARVAERVLRAHVDEVFAAGLLCDVGILALAQFEASRHGPEFAAHGASDRLVGAERAALGCSHVDVGVALLERWELPQTIVECVLQHHDFEGVGPMPACVRAAELLATGVETGESEDVAAGLGFATRVLGLPSEELLSVVVDGAGEAGRAARLDSVVVSEVEADRFRSVLQETSASGA